MKIAPKIDAQLVFKSDLKECIKLYNQFVKYFNGNFKFMKNYYGWKRKSLLLALRMGKGAK